MEKKSYRVAISHEECKGCERCVNACPRRVLKMNPRLNKMGFPTAEYGGSGCIGCSNCFYTCPEPGAVTVIQIIQDREESHTDGNCQ